MEQDGSHEEASLDASGGSSSSSVMDTRLVLPSTGTPAATAGAVTAVDSLQTPQGILALIPVIRQEGLVAICRRAYDLPALAALALEAAGSEQILATSCLLVQAVALVRHWHLQAASGQHPCHPRNRKMVQDYGQIPHAHCLACSRDEAARISHCLNPLLCASSSPAARC